MEPFVFDAIGTHWTIDIDGAVAPERRAALRSRIDERIALFDKDYSRFREDSLVTRMAREAGTYTLPADARPMLDLYRDLYRLTDGAFTPLIGQVLVDAGYDASYSLRPGTPVPPPAWDEALAYAYPALTVKRPALLDFGAAGKGYLVDIVAGILEEEGFESYCVDAGGDMRVRRAEPLRIALEDPRETANAIGIATVGSGSLCGSAGNRRAWGPYHHIIDPHTLASPRHLLATWVTAETAMLADALAGCLFFVDPAMLTAYDFEYALVRADGALDRSPGFPAEFFTSAA